MWMLIALSTLFVSNAQAQETLTIPSTLQRRCVKQHEAGACYQLAALYNPSSNPKLVQAATKLVLEGCRLELKRECKEPEARARGEAFLKASKTTGAVVDKMVEASAEDAKNPYVIQRKKDEAACLKGDGKACSGVSVYYQVLAPVTNLQKAREWDEKGCALGDSTACGSVELHKKGIMKVYKVEM